MDGVPPSRKEDLPVYADGPHGNVPYRQGSGVTSDLIVHSICRSTKKRDAKNDVPLARKNFGGQF